MWCAVCGACRNRETLKYFSDKRCLHILPPFFSFLLPFPTLSLTPSLFVFVLSACVCVFLCICVCYSAFVNEIISCAANERRCQSQSQSQRRRRRQSFPFNYTFPADGGRVHGRSRSRSQGRSRGAKGQCLPEGCCARRKRPIPSPLPPASNAAYGDAR